MKPTPPYFQNISHDEAEKKVIKRFRELHEKDDKAFKYFNISVIAVILVSSLIVGSAIAVTIAEYWIPVRRAFLNFVFWVDDLSWVGNLFILLHSLAFVIWFYIHRSAVKSRG